MNQNHRNTIFPCISNTLHRAGSKTPHIVINRHQVIGLIYHVAIPFDITLAAILVSDDLFSAAMSQDKVHP